ncbi:cupredoxin domain-containing protein [Candidatus Pacearchaeota archaeon]|nr:cupredoxin domain-containing protein [Candidatus Pacearchaeota archaeon]
MSKSTLYGILIFLVITDKTVDYNTERKVLSVRENRTKCITIIGFLYILMGFIFLRPNSAVITGNIVNSDVIQRQVQKVLIGTKNFNYYPNEIKVKANQPVSIALDSSVAGCLRSFNIKDLGVSKYAKTPIETIDFTPAKKGTFKFTCSMGMGYGNLIAE